MQARNPAMKVLGKRKCEQQQRAVVRAHAGEAIVEPLLEALERIAPACAAAARDGSCEAWPLTASWPRMR